MWSLVATVVGEMSGCFAVEMSSGGGWAASGLQHFYNYSEPCATRTNTES